MAAIGCVLKNSHIKGAELRSLTVVLFGRTPPKTIVKIYHKVEALKANSTFEISILHFILSLEMASLNGKQLPSCPYSGSLVCKET